MKSTESIKQMVLHYGFTCQVSPLLPVDETTVACNIETREEVKIATGVKINCVRFGNKLIMTQELYEEIKKLTADEKSKIKSRLF